MKPSNRGEKGGSHRHDSGRVWGKEHIETLDEGHDMRIINNSLLPDDLNCALEMQDPVNVGHARWLLLHDTKALVLDRAF